MIRGAGIHRCHRNSKLSRKNYHEIFTIRVGRKLSFNHIQSQPEDVFHIIGQFWPALQAIATECPFHLKPLSSKFAEDFQCPSVNYSLLLSDSEFAVIRWMNQTPSPFFFLVSRNCGRSSHFQIGFDFIYSAHFSGKCSKRHRFLFFRKK